MDNSKTEDLNFLLQYIKEQIDKLPITQSKKDKMLEKLLMVHQMTIDAREPRIALVGRRGSGKSSLINALYGSEKQYVSSIKSGTGRGKWLWFPSEDDKKIRLLDSRGLGESEKPTEEFNESNPMDEMKRTVSEELPDVFLFLIKAKETDARIEEDLNELKDLREYVKDEFNYDVPVICVVTQVDEVDPPHYKQVPLDKNVKKAKNIQDAVVLMEKRFEEHEIPLLSTIPVCSYIDFDEDGNIDYDMRWNIDRLANYLIESLPNEAKLKAAKATRVISVKKKFALSIVGIIASISGGIGTQPIPVADLPFITALQGLMVVIIAFIAGKEINTKIAAEFIAALGINIGVAFLVREGVRAAVKFIPGGGNIVSGTVAGGVTFGLGLAAIAYFIEEEDIETSKELLKKGKRKYNEDNSAE
ncbi:GTPase family protein [Thalassobacillus sp. B23F22_16]|uniref:GTPase family protein n=1 Tax=Thalassobacillus sp. B23F22_16 TaxID=3459513 RepID=UPI00373EB653